MSEMQDRSSLTRQIVWRAAEYEHRVREAHWYWITGTLAVILILLSLKQANYFFAVFVFMSALLLMLNYNRKPFEYDFVLDGSGIRCGKHTFYSFKSLQGFALREREGFATDILVLKQTKKYSMYVKIPVPKELIPRVRSQLFVSLAEFDYEETLAETISDWLGL